MICLEPFRLFLLVFLIFVSGISPAAETDLIPVEVFARAQGYRNAKLSPDGQHVAVLDLAGEQPTIRVFKLGLNKVSSIGDLEFAESQIGEMFWVNSSNLMISQTLTPAVLKPNANLWRRLIRIDIKTSQIEELWSVKLNRLVANEPESILRVLNVESGDVLVSMPQDTGFYPAVYELNIFSGKTTLLEPETPGVTKWLPDWDGRIRLATGINKKNKSLVWYRESEGKAWTDLSEEKIFSDRNFLPIAFNKSGNKLYMKSALGRAREGFYELDIRHNRITRKIYEHPKYDLGQILLANLDREVVGVTYIDDYLEIDYLSESMKQILALVNKRLPKSRNILMDWSLDKEVLLVLSERVPFPAQYYIFKSNNNELTELPGSKLGVYQYPLILPERVTYFSRDGLEIPAYLTRPQKSDGRARATVILPHGGPWSRDYIRFNDWAQFFASRGYNVLQPNFRGSTGYGILFERRGFGEWGEGMQQDLEDGVLWLIERGIADPEHICIAGASYGGYAALMASIRNTELFKCAIAFAPVTDLKKYANSFAKSPYKKSLQSMIWGENGKSDIRLNSPVRHGKDVAIPLLLIHGTSDIRVPVSHSRKMVRALKRSKTKVTYLELQGESHFLNKLSSRRQVFSAMEKHLQQSLAKP